MANAIVVKKMINYKKSKQISRTLLLNLSELLDITFKKDARVELDKRLLMLSGNNKYPIIVNCESYYKKTVNATIKEINKIAKQLYTNNTKKNTIVRNIDTNTEFEIGNMGISKTFSKRVPAEKKPTVFILRELIEQAVYYKTSFNEFDKDGIKYHHFLAIVKINNKYNNIVRIVFKEYTKDKNLYNKFYYHQFEYIKKELPIQTV